MCLRKLAYDLAQGELESNGRARSIPIFMDMGTYDGWENEEGRLPTLILDFIRQQLATHIAVRNRPNHPLLYIARDLDVLLEQGRIACIFDALDEMPQDSYQERYQAIKDFMAAWQGKGNRFVYSCRSLDYDPSFNVDEVIIDAFDRTRIKKFLVRHVKPLYAGRGTLQENHRR